VGEPLWEDALYYHEENNATPYTGPIEAAYTNGNKRMLAFMRKGRLDGSSIIWFDSEEQEQFNIDYKTGNITAYKEFYEENGTVKYEYPDPSPMTPVVTAPPPTPPDTNEVKLSQLELRGGLVYRMNDGIPFGSENDDTAIERWPNGVVKKRETFWDGEHNGSVKWWHENGKRWYSATYEAGFPVGKVEAWRPDGTREYIYTWEDGFPSSKVSYAPDGTESGRITNDTGTLIYFHPNGKKKLEEVYEGNILAPAKQIWYDENGLQIDPTPNPPGIPSLSN
jgi:antitoxin component YwqK of YwqJK toxin-antitoxin module